MKKYEVEINGERYEVSVRELEADADMAHTQSEEKPTPEKQEAPPVQPHAGGGNAVIRAPMAGTILKIHATPGQKVSQGDTLLVLEAMKMENEVVAPEDGVIQEVHVRENERVASDQLLVTL
jgi:biotin carboxyl carrier protein